MEKVSHFETKPDEGGGGIETSGKYKNLLETYPNKLISNSTTLEELKMLIPGIDFRLEEIESKGSIFKERTIYINGDDFDEEVAKRFVTFNNNVGFDLEAETAEGVRSIIENLRSIGNLVVYKDGYEVDKFLAKDNPDFNSVDPWDSKRVTEDHQNFGSYLVSQELTTPEEISEWIKIHKTCDVYVAGEKTRFKLRIRAEANGRLAVIFRQFGFNPGFNSGQPEDKFQKESAIIYPLAQSLRNTGNVILGSRDDEVKVRHKEGVQTWTRRVTLSKISS